MDYTFPDLLDQFKRHRDAYLWLRAEIKRVKAEIEKTVERLDLLRKLLALEGEKVDLPSE